MDPLPLGRCNEKISLKQCNRWANLICLHCNQSVCLEHYEKHQNDIQIRADKLNNQINDLRQILHSLTYENFQQKIDQWSEKCKNEIDLKHKTMSEQLSKEFKQINLEQFRSIQLNNIDEYLGKPLIDLLHTSNNIQIESLEKKFQQIEKIIHDMNSFIQITDQGQLKINSNIPIYQHFLTDCPGAMSGSSLYHNYLLIFQSKPNYSLIFIDNNQHIIQTSIDYFVYDICWSQSTEVFLIATEYYLYEYCPLTNRLSQSYGNLKSTRILWSLTCSLTDLYVIYKPDMIMYQRNIQKPFEKKKVWLKNDILCGKNDQIIGSIRIDEEKQILSIKQIDDQWRIDLFSIDNMQRLHCGSSFGISTSFCVMTPLFNQWLVQFSTNEKSQTIILDENAQVINKIDRSGYNLTLLNRDKIVYLNHSGVQIYQR